MAATVHIWEAEVARDFPALADRAIAGEEIVLRRGDRDVITLSPIRTSLAASRPLGEVISLLKQRRQKQGLNAVNDECAADIEDVRCRPNHPLDGSSWE
jgi:antitoxin (DNA-binding transcriptional repressor) of toxin-antitoxin stability system